MATRGARDIAESSDFVAARSGALFRTAYLVLGDHQLAQDLVQESLVKTYVAWPRLRDVRTAEAYTRRVIVNTAISWRRKRSFHERPAEFVPEREAPDRIDAFAAADALWVHLHGLAPRQRAAIVLRYYEDLTEVQTAEVMGCAVGTVKSQVSAGLRHLRERMGPAAAAVGLDDEEGARS